jgi:small subunit ribosomal protein S10
VLTSPHTDKNAREHFEMLTHKRLIDITNASLKTLDSLQHLDLPSGVEVEVKM